MKIKKIKESLTTSNKMLALSPFFYKVGLLLYCLADRRGVNKQFCLIMGILFSPFSLPFIFLGKRKDVDTE